MNAPYRRAKKCVLASYTKKHYTRSWLKSVKLNNLSMLASGCLPNPGATWCIICMCIALENCPKGTSQSAHDCRCTYYLACLNEHNAGGCDHYDCT